jgi:hypothetical protein
MEVQEESGGGGWKWNLRKNTNSAFNSCPINLLTREQKIKKLFYNSHLEKTTFLPSKGVKCLF